LVTVEKDGFSVVPKTEEIVLKFRYLPKLKVHPKGAAEISPEEAFVEDIGGGKVKTVYFVKLKVSKSAISKSLPIKISY
ncbi:MAG: hypothetical protein D6780_03280, partial [Candidatus Dadabacteria bacterium]